VVLDIGCGNFPAPRAAILADYFPDAQFHRSGALTEDRPVVVCNIERLPFLNHAFDFVICSHILEHVESPARAMQEVTRIALAGYSETPAYGKDILVGTGTMHRWQVVEFDGVMHFFEYSQRQREGQSGATPFMQTWMERCYDPWQDFFWERQDLFNAQLLWKAPPEIVEYRRAGRCALPLPPWQPVAANRIREVPAALSEAEIRLLEGRLATPDGSRPMHYEAGAFADAQRQVIYPVRGKRVYCEVADDPSRAA
jgi:SAM-dependent methyltransferase